MRIIELKEETKEKLCMKLKRAKEAIMDVEDELKESQVDSRYWEARGDYRDYREPREKWYKDDFRYR